MSALTEANQIAKREDLSDVIATVDAKSTPLCSMIPKGAEPCNTLFEWQADAFDDNNTDGVLDLADATSFDKQNKRQKLSGRVQKMWRKPQVSDFAQNISDVAGVGKRKEFAKEVALGITNLKRDQECVVGSDNDSQAESGTDPYKTRGLGSWISSGAQADTATAVPTAFRTPAAAIDATATGSLTETEVQDVLEAVWQECGTLKTYKMICGSKLKRAFTSLASFQAGITTTKHSIRTFNQDGTNKTFESCIDFFRGDFGELELHPSTFLDHGGSDGNFRGYVLDMNLLELRYNRKPQFRELEDKGGGRRGIIDAIFALCVKSPLGLAKFAATS